MASERSLELDSGAAALVVGAACSWAEIAARVLADRHGREGGVVAGDQRSVVVVRRWPYHVSGGESACRGENPVWLGPARL